MRSLDGKGGNTGSHGEANICALVHPSYYDFVFHVPFTTYFSNMGSYCWCTSFLIHGGGIWRHHPKVHKDIKQGINKSHSVSFIYKTVRTLLTKATNSHPLEGAHYITHTKTPWSAAEKWMHGHHCTCPFHSMMPKYLVKSVSHKAKHLWGDMTFGSPCPVYICT